MTNPIVTPKCSFCDKVAHWFAIWVHGYPEFTVILDGDNLDGKTLYCDDHERESTTRFRGVP
jgi:hypothetical protein